MDTLQTLEAIDREWLTPAQVAAALHWDAHAIRMQAREDPKKLGFPVVVYRSRVKIPKRPFLSFMQAL